MAIHKGMSKFVTMNPKGTKDRLVDGLLVITSIGVALTLPFYNLLNSYALMAFGLVALLSNSIPQKISSLQQDKLSWGLPVFYFLIVALHFFFDQGRGKSSLLLETNASLICLPIILGSMKKLKDDSLKKIMISFVAANVLASFYCFFKAFGEYEATDHYVNVFFYHHLSEHVGISAIYFSMYNLFCILILLYYYFFRRTRKKYQIFSFLTIGYLAFCVILLSSKMFIFLLCVSGFGVLVHSMLFFGRLRRGAITILMLCVAIPILLYVIPYSKSRIEYTQVKKYEGVEDNNNGLAVREVLWKSAWDLIKERASLIGRGHFSAQEALRSRYQQAGFEDGANRNYNSHNQYLYTWISYGLIALAILLIFLFRMFWISIRKRIFLAAFLSAIIIIANITECMFETQKGIVFFFFFSGLLLFHKPEMPDEKDENGIRH
jgi:O-antigen ligase